MLQSEKSIMMAAIYKQNNNRKYLMFSNVLYHSIISVKIFPAKFRNFSIFKECCVYSYMGLFGGL